MKDYKCHTCSVTKDISNFTKNKHKSMGFEKSCKECVNLRSRQLRAARKEQMLNEMADSMNRPKLNSELSQFDIEKEAIPDGKLKHFTSLFVAQSESGKTILMMHLINKIREHYDYVVLISKNLQADSYDLKKFDFATNDKNLESVIMAIRYLQRNTNNKFHFLVVIDDIKTRGKTIIQDLFTNGRNSNISTMNLVQHPTMIDNHMRTNCKFIFLFNQRNPELIKATINKFLINFVATPPTVLARRAKEDYLEAWLQNNTKDYTSIVLNIKNGIVQKVKADVKKKK
jgi:hypothetical protein